MESPEPVREISDATPLETSHLAFFSRLWELRGTLSRTEPSVLWHYTSGENLIAIIEASELWTTQVSCLNDQSELVHAASLLTHALQEIRDLRRGDKDQAFLTRAIERLSRNVALSSDVFVASFSEVADDLSQWRAYGGGEGGYVIGFHREGINFGLDPGHLVLPVEYDIDEQIKIMAKVAEAAFTFYRDNLTTNDDDAHKFIVESAIPLMMDGLAFVGPFLKNDAFKSEREWRVVWQLPERQDSRLKIRQKKTLLSRHFPLDFRRGGVLLTDKLPIASIGVGPCRHPGVSTNSVEALLKSKGYPTRNAPLALCHSDGFPMDRVSVWASDIPYQTV